MVQLQGTPATHVAAVAEAELGIIQSSWVESLQSLRIDEPGNAIELSSADMAMLREVSRSVHQK